MTKDEVQEQKPSEPANSEQSATEQELIAEAHNPETEEPETKDTPAEIDETEKLKAEVAEWRDKYMRLYAEFDNFRKRSMKERVEILQTASADLMKELLPVLDDFDRAAKANETAEDLAAVKEGFILIQNKLYKKLESKGLKPLNAKGELFNTDFHEAITQVPAPAEDMKGKVVDEVEKGYLLNEKVIRYSKVVIGQ